MNCEPCLTENEALIEITCVYLRAFEAAYAETKSDELHSFSERIQQRRVDKFHMLRSSFHFLLLVILHRNGYKDLSQSDSEFSMKTREFLDFVEEAHFPLYKDQRAKILPFVQITSA